MTTSKENHPKGSIMLIVKGTTKISENDFFRIAKVYQLTAPPSTEIIDILFDLRD